MNHLGAGTFDAMMLKSIGADVSALLTDADTAVSATVFTPSGPASVHPSTGIRSESGDQDSVTGWLSDLTLKEIGDSGGVYQRGDRRLLVRVSDLSASPTTASRFTVSTSTYAVVEATKDPLGLFWRLVGRLRT